MKSVYALIGLFALFAFGASALLADEAGAQRKVAEYERERSAWIARLNATEGVEARRALWANAPLVDEFGEELLRELDGSWDKSWFLDYAPQLLRLAPNYSIRPIAPGSSRTPLSVIRDSAERFHFESPKIGFLCMTLTIDSGPKTRVFLEKVEKTHPDRKVQGQAAMALALLSRQLGDGGDVAEFKAQRLRWVRKAIIEAEEVQLGEVRIGQIAEDFLFAITNLDKGMEAPDILGRMVDERALRLADYRGKPVMIVFWHSRMEAFEKTMAFLRKVESRLGPRGLVVLGVAAEGRPVMRRLMQDGTVTWQNWLDEDGKLAKLYQVNKYPACWVLDAEGKVEINGVPGSFAELTAEALVKDLEKKN